MTSRTVFAGLLLLIASFRAGAQAQSDLDKWVAANSSPEETVLCRQTINGEHFFIARSGANRVRLGVHLDATEYKDSHSLGISWTLTDEHGDTAVEEERPPAKVKMEDSHSNNGKTFADYVEYQWLRLTPKTLNVDIEIEKCPVLDCDTDEGQRLRKVYAFKLCQTSL